MSRSGSPTTDASFGNAQSIAAPTTDEFPGLEQGLGTGSALGRRLARKLLLTKLEDLERDVLEVVDGSEESGRWTFGSDADDPSLGAALRATVRIHDARFYPKAVFGGSIGVAEAFMAGWWSADDLVTALRIFVRNRRAMDGLDSGVGRLLLPIHRAVQALRANTRRGSRRNIGAHYDLSNEFFRLFLDPEMMYSSAVFEDDQALDLDQAQVAKLDRLARKLDLRPGDHLLEIGTGWGGCAIHAARAYGCRVTTTTISRQQYEVAVERVRREGLDDLVTVLLEDYRDLGGTFDKLISIEMIEAVGHRYLDGYFRTCAERLAPHGLMAIQGIVMADRHFEEYKGQVDFIQRYVFPGSALPSVGSICASVGRATDLQVVHLEDIGPHYARTLAAWRDRFFDRLEEVRRLGFSERFVRLWEFYLGYCEAGFLERSVGDVQMVFAKPDNRRASVLGRL